MEEILGLRSLPADGHVRIDPCDDSLERTDVAHDICVRALRTLRGDNAEQFALFIHNRPAGTLTRDRRGKFQPFARRVGVSRRNSPLEM